MSDLRHFAGWLSSADAYSYCEGLRPLDVILATRSPVAVEYSGSFLVKAKVRLREAYDLRVICTTNALVGVKVTRSYIAKG